MKQKILKILTGITSISLPLALVILFSFGYLRSEILGLVSLIIIGELILITWFLIHIIYKEDIDKSVKKSRNRITNQITITQSASPVIIDENVSKS